MASTYPIRRFVLPLVAVACCVFAGRCAAQNEVGPALYQWRGEPVAGAGNLSGPWTGSGDAGDWSQLLGRKEFTVIDPETGEFTVEFFAPQDGDSIDFTGAEILFRPVGGKKSVALATYHALDSATFGLRDADFSGGEIDAATVIIANQSLNLPLVEGMPNQMTFNNTKFAADEITLSAGEFLEAIDDDVDLTFLGGSLRADVGMKISAGFASPIFNPQGLPSGEIRMEGMQLNAATLTVNDLIATPNVSELHWGLKNVTGTVSGDVLLSYDDTSNVKLAIEGGQSNLEWGSASGVTQLGVFGDADISVDGAGARFITHNTIVALGEQSNVDVVVRAGVWEFGQQGGFATIGGQGKAAVRVEQNGMLAGVNITIGQQTSEDNASSVSIHDSSRWGVDGYLVVGGGGYGRVELLNSSAAQVAGLVVVGSEPGAHGTLLVESAEELRVAGTFEAGRNGEAVVEIQGGGRLVTDGDAFAGTFQAGTGQVAIRGDGSAWESHGNFNLGNGASSGPSGGSNGEGRLIVEHHGRLAVAADKQLRVGRREGSIGELRLGSGGSATAGEVTAGVAGDGMIEIGADSRLDVAGANIVVGEATTGVGAIRLTAPTAVLSAPSAKMTIGRQGDGRLEILAGARHQSAGSDVLGTEESGFGTVVVEGANSEWRVNGNPVVGQAGRGVLQVRDGGVATVVNAFLGYESTGNGIALITGEDSRWSAAEAITVGHEGVGALTIAAGAHASADQEGIIAALEGSRGDVEVRGEGSQWRIGDDLIVGQGGAGSLVIADAGAVEVGGRIAIGLRPGSVGELLLDGADVQLVSSDNLLLAGEGAGRIEVANGAKLTLLQVEIGQTDDDGVQGELQIHGVGSAVRTTGEFVLGSGAKGMLRVEEGAALSTVGGVKLSRDEGSESDAMIVSTDQAAAWNIDGDAVFGEKGVSRIAVKDAATLDVSGMLELGAGKNGEGRMDVDGELASVSAQSLRVGNVGLGEVTISGRAKVSARNALISAASDPGKPERHATVFIEGEGSRFVVQDELVVGGEIERRGELQIANKAELTTEGQAILARDAGSRSDVVIRSDSLPGDAPATWTLQGDLTIGKGGLAFLDLINGGHIAGETGSNIVIGEMAGSRGVLKLDSHSALAATEVVHGGTIRIGQSGSGSVFVGDNSMLRTGGDVLVANATGADGYVRIHGRDGKWDVAGDFRIGGGASAELALDDHGQLIIGKSLVVADGAQPSQVSVLSNATVSTKESFMVAGSSHVVVSDSGSRLTAASYSLEDSATVEVLNGAVLEMNEEGGSIDVAKSARLVVRGNSSATSQVVMSGLFDSFIVDGQVQFQDYSRFDEGSSVVRIEDGAALEISGGNSHFVSQGLTVRDGGLVTLDNTREFGTVAGALVAGGVLKLRNASERGAGVEVFHGFDGPGELIIEGDSTTGRTSVGSGSTGVATVQSGAVWTVGNDATSGQLRIGGVGRLGATGQGFLHLKPGSTVHVLGDLVVSPGSVWDGVGTIIANNFRNDGVGSPGMSPGVLTIDANYTQSATGSIELEIGGMTPGAEHDQIVFNGNVDLGGDVILKFINGFAPATDDVFSLLVTDPGMQLDWDPLSIQVAGLAPGFEYAFDVTGGGVALRALNDGIALDLGGDFNGDDVVDGADFLSWQRGFGADFDANDLSDWQSNYGFQNKETPTSTAVPEPPSVWLALFAFALQFYRRRHNAEISR